MGGVQLVRQFLGQRKANSGSFLILRGRIREQVAIGTGLLRCDLDYRAINMNGVFGER